MKKYVIYVFKLLNGVNVTCLNVMLSVKQINYSMPLVNKLVQPKRKTSMTVLKTMSYLETVMD